MSTRKSGKSTGIRIAKIHAASPAHAAGLRKYDIILSVNGESVADDLDFTYFASCENLTIAFLRKDKKKTIDLIRQPGELLGIEFIPAPVRRCRNRCIFCFIDQLPRGLRKSLYVKDEDYRYSFLNGNYITLSSITANEMDRIIELGLAPLFISVHATDPDIRRNILNNKNAGKIMDQLRELEVHGITFHTQIVVCPGINDGAVLKKTIRDLLSFKKGLLSIAVVPVGLTKYQRNNLRPVSSEDAKRICRVVDTVSEQDKKKSGIRRLFLADELFLRAGIPIPTGKYYEEYPQIENGVGLIRLLKDEWLQVRTNLQNQNKKNRVLKKIVKSYLILSSMSALPYVKEIVDGLKTFFPNYTLDIEPVRNGYLGESVTVAGLITAHDVLRTIRRKEGKVDTVIVPNVMLNYKEYTLDGYSIARISRIVGINVVAVENLADLATLLEEEDRGKK